MTILMKLLICIVLIAGTGPESDGCRLKTVTVLKGEVRPVIAGYKEPEAALRFIKPADGTLSMKYGKGKHPFTKKEFFHKGIDIKGPKGSSVKASCNGKIIIAREGEKKDGRGKYILIKHSDGYETLYSHLSCISVKKGDFVRQGEKIGETGSTGRSTGPHLHFEIRKNGRNLNPSELFGK